MPFGSGPITRDGRGTAASTIRPFLSRAFLRRISRALALAYVACAAGGWGGGVIPGRAWPVEVEVEVEAESAPASDPRSVRAAGEAATVEWELEAEREPGPQEDGGSPSAVGRPPPSIADSDEDPSPAAAARELPADAPTPPPATASASEPAVAPPVSAPEDAPYQSLVTASRFESRAAREDVAATSSVIIPAESPRARDDLGSLLLEVPGANVTRRGGLGSFASLSLRGSNPDEVRIYVDGVPLNQAVGGAVDLSTLPLGDVERVEIYRGSTPISFGESALGGVVSIVTRTPGGPAAASLRGGVGSFRTTFADATGAGTFGPLRLYAGVHALRAAGDFPDAPPDVPGGYQPARRENDDLSQVDGVIRAALSLRGRRELRLGAIGIWRDQGLPAQNIFESQARAATSRGLLHLDYESRDDLGDSSRLRVVVFGAATRDAFVDPMHQIAVAPTATHDVTRTLGATLTAEKAMAGWGRLSGIVEGRLEEYVPTNDFDPGQPRGFPADRQLASMGAELDALVAPVGLHVIPSARLELSRDVRTGRDVVFGAQRPPAPALERAIPVLRLGLLRPLGEGLAVRANVGRYTRLPSFLELYGYNRGVLGNPDLVPEHGVNADVQLAASRRVPFGAWSAAVTAFGSLVDDLIEWHPTSYQTRAENIARARIWGVEAEGRLRARRLTLAAQATLTDARDRSDVLAARDQQLVFHPRYRGYGRAEWRQPLAHDAFAIGVFADIDATAGNHRAVVYGDIPPQTLLGAGLSLDHAPSGLRLVASGANLTDDRTQSFPDYPIPGRTLFVSLGWTSSPPSSSSSSSSSSSASPIAKN